MTFIVSVLKIFFWWETYGYFHHRSRSLSQTLIYSVFKRPQQCVRILNPTARFFIGKKNISSKLVSKILTLFNLILFKYIVMNWYWNPQFKIIPLPIFEWIYRISCSFHWWCYVVLDWMQFYLMFYCICSVSLRKKNMLCIFKSLQFIILLIHVHLVF